MMALDEKWGDHQHDYSSFVCLQMYKSTKCHCDPFNSCWDLLVWAKMVDRPKVPSAYFLSTPRLPVTESEAALLGKYVYTYKEFCSVFLLRASISYLATWQVNGRKCWDSNNSTLGKTSSTNTKLRSVWSVCRDCFYAGGTLEDNWVGVRSVFPFPTIAAAFPGWNRLLAKMIL